MRIFMQCAEDKEYYPAGIAFGRKEEFQAVLPFGRRLQCHGCGFTHQLRAYNAKTVSEEESLGFEPGSPAAELWGPGRIERLSVRLGNRAPWAARFLRAWAAERKLFGISVALIVVAISVSWAVRPKGERLDFFGDILSNVFAALFFVAFFSRRWEEENENRLDRDQLKSRAAANVEHLHRILERCERIQVDSSAAAVQASDERSAYKVALTLRDASNRLYTAQSLLTTLGYRSRECEALSSLSSCIAMAGLHVVRHEQPPADLQNRIQRALTAIKEKSAPTVGMASEPHFEQLENAMLTVCSRLKEFVPRQSPVRYLLTHLADGHSHLAALFASEIEVAMHIFLRDPELAG